MKTTIDIPDMVMEETAAFSGAKTKREAILIAMEEYNHRHKVAEVVKLFGTFRSIMSNDEIEALEEERDFR
jgi:hypothetical protein